MKNIKLLIKEELVKKQIRQEYIHESYLPLKNISNKKLLPKYIKITSKLIEEGYTPNEIETVLEQEDNIFTKIAKNFYNSNDQNSILNTVGGGLKSGLKERIILGILSYLGIKGTFVKDLVVVFSDYDIRDILKPFKNKQMCISYAPPLVDSIIEIVISHAIDNNVSPDFKSSTDLGDMAKVGVRNIFAQAEKQSNFGEIVSNKFCAKIWGE